MSGSGISWAICKSAPHSRQITTPAPTTHVFYRPDALPAAQPTASKHWRLHNELVIYIKYIRSTSPCAALYTRAYAAHRMWHGLCSAHGQCNKNGWTNQLNQSRWQLGRQAPNTVLEEVRTQEGKHSNPFFTNWTLFTINKDCDITGPICNRLMGCRLLVQA